VAQTSKTLDGYQVSGARLRVSEGVEGGYAGAKQGGGFGERDAVGNKRKRLDRNDHVLGVAAIIGEAGDAAVFTQDEVAFTAGGASPAVSSVPAHADPLARLDVLDLGTYCVDYTRHFVPGNPG